MKAYFFCYDSCTVFEFILLAYLLQTKYIIHYVGLDEKSLQTYEGLCIRPEMTLGTINFNEGDLLIIPGGNIETIKDNPVLTETLYNLTKKNGRVAAICAGVELLALHGLITEEMNVMKNANNILLDEQFILAKPNAYIDFAIETAKIFQVYQDDADYRETVEFFKMGKSKQPIKL